MHSIVFFLLVLSFVAIISAHFPVYSVYGEERKPADVFRMLADMRSKMDKKNIPISYYDY